MTLTQLDWLRISSTRTQTLGWERIHLIFCPSVEKNVDIVLFMCDAHRYYVRRSLSEQPRRALGVAGEDLAATPNR